MRTSCFDAVVNFSPEGEKGLTDAVILHKESKTFASFSFYQGCQETESGGFFVRVHTSEPLPLIWNDRFRVQMPKKRALLGEGRVLNPISERIRGKKVKKRIAFLQKLQGDEKEMLAALVEERGIHGVREREAVQFGTPSRRRLLSLSQELEEKGRLRIISFAPLFLLSKKNFDFLCQKILEYLSSFHEKHPGEQGATLGQIQKRFNVDTKILSLALSRLSKERKIKNLEDVVSLFDFERTLSPQEERILEKLEKMCYEGEFHSLSLKDLQKSFRLSPQKIDRLLSLLTERKKIVLGREGYIIHSRWLDQIVSQIRDSGKKELTVSEFKKMTGLSRKYAIPLLELLDQLGVTRRKGPSREVL